MILGHLTKLMANYRLNNCIGSCTFAKILSLFLGNDTLKYRGKGPQYIQFILNSSEKKLYFM